jgi:hypothetical protein
LDIAQRALRNKQNLPKRKSLGRNNRKLHDEVTMVPESPWGILSSL